ncbi:MAG TPA: hypothetical protein VHJ18_18930 [Streptosporangiaceae bacterium]|jgi:hypothetical protein|nr:hypothetical protein [Streptosporangiaceae bacterium]
MRHVSAEVLALHREGAVNPRKAGRITAHLRVCEICAGVDADLGVVTSLLISTQLRPMPQVYVERVQLAIANEAALRTATSTAAVIAPGTAEAVGTDATGVVAGGPGEVGVPGVGAGAGGGAGQGIGDGGDEAAHIPGRPELPERRRSRSRRLRMPNWSSPLLLRGLAAAGAVVIVAGAGALFIRGHTSSGSNGTASSGAGAPAKRVHQGESGPRPSAASGSGTYSGVNRPVSMNYRLNGRVATARALTTRHNYTRRNMKKLVQKDVASTTIIGKKATPGTYAQLASPGALLGGIKVLKLMGCLTRLAAGRSILVADVAKYLGQPATIVVMRSSASAHELNVAVVRLTCSRASPEIIAQVTIPTG